LRKLQNGVTIYELDRDIIISPCISECANNGDFCPACGRTMEEKFEWKQGADNTRKKNILENCANRLPRKDFEHWKEMYELKVAEKMRENNNA
tara:strand:- start:67 stop:345 length:279 start_codon:yes stop_codon:yes gene_type:complete